jgi:hypothetical protein
MGVQNPAVRMFFQSMELGESSRNGEILQESSTKMQDLCFFGVSFSRLRLRLLAANSGVKSPPAIVLRKAVSNQS